MLVSFFNYAGRLTIGQIDVLDDWLDVQDVGRLKGKFLKARVEQSVVFSFDYDAGYETDVTQRGNLTKRQLEDSKVVDVKGQLMLVSAGC